MGLVAPAASAYGSYGYMRPVPSAVGETSGGGAPLSTPACVRVVAVLTVGILGARIRGAPAGVGDLIVGCMASVGANKRCA